MNLPDELLELYEARECKNQRIFQKFFAKPMMEYHDKLGKAYDCKTTEELAQLKGEAKAAKKFISLLKEVDIEIKIQEEQLNTEAGE
jgi:hypothetical protein